MSKIAFIFPGQGSQFVGMAKDLYDQSERVKELFALAADVLGFDLAAVCFEGPEEELKQTRATQPAIFVHSVALYEFVRERGLVPDMVAGHSLGEYSALLAAGAFGFEDGLRLVKCRAELMQKAGEIQPGTMAAIIGMNEVKLADVCARASSAGVVQVANLNSESQIVISGSVAGVERAMELARAEGAKRVVPLVVGGAFHSPLMEYAIEGLQQALQAADIRDAKVPVFSNVTAQPVTNGQQIRELLLRQMTSPVRWFDITRNMIAEGAGKFYEIGPGSVLTGLTRRTSREVTAVAVNSLESVEQISENNG